MRIARPADADYEKLLDRLCHRPVASDPEVAGRVRAIIAEVRARGERALRELTQRFENRSVDPIELPEATWRAEAQRVDPRVRCSLAEAARRITAYHSYQRQAGYLLDADGLRLELRSQPLDRIAAYAPGGTARYPSSVLMTVIPAGLAGVREIVLCTPGPSPETLAAAELAGVHRVIQLGGAQAVAALAYGTASVPRVDKIVGPGNAYVAEAKRQVFGDVAIDAVAGPSEVLLLADAKARADLIASDLLAQAEHGPDSVAVLVTPADALAIAVLEQLSRQLVDLPRRTIAEAALAQGALIVTPDLSSAINFANRFAAEHVGLHLEDARRYESEIRHAGAIFVGPYSPEALGDYLAGPNHVLPTAGTARFWSPLGVHDFVKRTSVIEATADALCRDAGHVTRLARAEGLEAHARSVELRSGVKHLD
jgi:histidinol dehydrogenase